MTQPITPMVQKVADALAVAVGKAAIEGGRADGITLARAAIEALREPGRDELDAIWKACGNPQIGEPWPGRALGIHRAMISAALGEKPE